MSENVFIDLKDRSHVMSTEDEIPENGAKRALLGHAERFGGWSLSIYKGRQAVVGVRVLAGPGEDLHLMGEEQQPSRDGTPTRVEETCW
jgi:hypothetical protein